MKGISGKRRKLQRIFGELSQLADEFKLESEIRSLFGNNAALSVSSFMNEAGRQVQGAVETIDKELALSKLARDSGPVFCQFCGGRLPNHNAGCWRHR